MRGDSGVNAVKRRLQTMLTEPFTNSGVFGTLSELGFETRYNYVRTYQRDPSL